MKSIKPQFKFIRFESVMTVVFILVVLLEMYILYTKVYAQLNPEANAIQTENIVRLDISSYNQTIDLLDNLKSFVAKPVNLNNSTPF
ncbi:MAG TPA: hypothetical protein VL306_00065 [Methylomirabilota bacterium]|jgi:hypothetical protein|nr:hypothetical protein [Methylomirabilota bacterium]